MDDNLRREKERLCQDVLTTGYKTKSELYAAAKRAGFFDEELSPECLACLTPVTRNKE